MISCGMDGIFEGELQWLEPYYERVKHKLGSANLTRVYPVPLKQDCVSRFLGKCSTVNDKDFEISLYTQYWLTQKLYPLIRVRRNLSTIDILHSFAHELAHLVYWDHTPERMKLECDIMKMFMTMLKNDGYISEEDEFA